MTARIILTIKFLIIWLYSYAISPIAKIFLQIDATTTAKEPPESVFWFFVLMIFLPEIDLTVSKGFRTWIKQGIENSDNKLNHRDVKDLIVHYASLSSLRVFVLESLLMMFFDVNIPFQYYIVPFFGSIGLSGFTIMKNMYQSK